MKLGLMADLHLRGSDLAVKSRVLYNALQQMQARGVQWVLDAGDTFDSPRLLDRHALPGSLVRGFLDPVEDVGLPWLIVNGNHTTAGTRDRGALAVLQGHPLVEVVEQPAIIRRVDPDTGTEVRVACLPWLSRVHLERTPAEEVLEDLRRGLVLGPRPGYSILLGHCEVRGSRNAYRFILPGSTYEFTQEQLDGVGAKLVALGHYHARQGAYLGALAQLNHGESGNETGWLFVDAESGLREFVAVDAPRYYTVDLADYRAENYRPWDQVRVLGAEPPEVELPPNVRFEHRPEVRAVQERVPGLDPSAPLPALVGEWMRAAGIEGEAPLEELAGLAGLAGQETGDLHGSLTRIHQVRIAGIGPHVDTRADYRGGDWWAIHGPNGSGKTFALEAIIATLYGQWAHPRRGTLYSTMTAPTAELEVEFEAAGSTWRAVRRLRTTGRSTTQEATLYQGDAPVAGPKVSDFQAETTRLVGPLSLLLGGIFLSQKAEGDLVGGTASERQEFMREYLGLDRFDHLADRAKSLADEAEGAIAAQEAQLVLLDQVEGTLPGLREAVAAAQGRVASLEVTIQEKERAQALETREGTRLKVLQDQRTALDLAAAAAVRNLDALTVEVHNLAGREAEARANLAREPELRRKVDDLAGVRQELEALNARATLVAMARTARATAEAQVQGHRRTIQEAERHARRDLDVMARDLAAAEKALQAAREQSGGLDEVGCRSQGFLPCPLIEGARRAAGTVPALEDELERLREAHVAAEGHLRSEAFCLSERTALALAERELAGIVIPEGPDPRREAELRRQLATLATAERDLGALDQLRRSLEVLASDLATKRQALADAEEAAREARRVANAAQDVSGQLVASRQRWEHLGRLLLGLRRDLGSAQEALGKAQAAVATAEERVAEARALREDLVPRRARRDRLRLLQRAFGKDGLPQLLISNAIPAIQAILDEVCSVDFGGEFSLRLDTQRALKGGGAREAFEILFSRGGAEYDASGASGGEEAAVRAALRTALVLYQAARASGSYRVAFLDEPAANQDAEHAEATMRMLDRLRDRFGQVFVVTHDEDLIASFEHRIELGGAPQPTPATAAA